MRIAAVDCGTNSIRLLVADLDQATGTLVEVERTMQIVRLGEGVDQTGRLSQGALERTFAACDEYGARIRSLGAQRVRFVATSATRDATNRAVFVAGVEQRIGVLPEVVAGADFPESFSLELASLVPGLRSPAAIAWSYILPITRCCWPMRHAFDTTK